MGSIKCLGFEFSSRADDLERAHDVQTLSSTAAKPLGVDALIRRYKPPQKADQSDAWTISDDRKINPGI